MANPHLSPRLTIRIDFGDADMIGHGKAELLERIAATGSIAAAARDMGMSYKRAWLLVETLNAIFDVPVVVSARGGPGRGGAVLTERGRAVLALYRTIEDSARCTAGESLAQLQSWLRPTGSR